MLTETRILVSIYCVITLLAHEICNDTSQLDAIVGILFLIMLHPGFLAYGTSAISSKRSHSFSFKNLFIEFLRMYSVCTRHYLDTVRQHTYSIVPGSLAIVQTRVW